MSDKNWKYLDMSDTHVIKKGKLGKTAHVRFFLFFAVTCSKTYFFSSLATFILLYHAFVQHGITYECSRVSP